MKKIDGKKVLDLIIKLYNKKTISKADSRVGLQYDPITIVEINLLRSLLNIECKDYHIIKAILAIKDINTIDFFSFEGSLKKITRSESVFDHSIKWEIIIPFEITISKRHLSVNGLTFKILSYSTLKKNYPLEYYRYFNEIKFETRKIENKKCKYLVVESDGSSLLRAWKTIEPAFNLLRGLLDFVISFNSWSFFTGLQIRTNIPHPKTVYGISSGSRADFLDFLVETTNSKQYEIHPKQILSFEKYLNVLEKIPIKNSVIDLLSDIFRLYSQAMDENDLQYCFLKFWQIAERISLSDSNGPSNDTIKKRITYFTDPTPEFDLSPYIDKLSKKRNDLVHRGIENIEETDFNILKSVCERGIQWIFFNRFNLKTTNHLEFFYNSKSLSEGEMKAAIDTLNYINKKKKN